jgi:hypothetical protein
VGRVYAGTVIDAHDTAVFADGLVVMGRRRCDDPTAGRIVAALAPIRQTDECWHGLAVWLSRSGMNRDAELLDRLAARAE